MKSKALYFALWLLPALGLTHFASAQSNVGVGTITPNAKALLDLSASDKGLLVPRLTSAQRLAINPAGNADAALLVYDTNDNLFYFWNGTQWVPFPQPGGSNNISLSYNAVTGVLSLTDAGGTLTAAIPPDNDADSTNELISGVTFNPSGNVLTITEGGNTWTTTISVADPDSDPTNEIQQLTLSNNVLNLSVSNNNIDLSPYLDNTDNQTLSIAGNTLSISNGNSVTLPDNVNDADSIPTNELQQLSLSGDTLSISNGNSVVIPTFPRGIICMWSGAVNNIPSGWALCDGTNGTPDLRDRFIVGAGSAYSVLAAGGTNSVSLSSANLPAHSHTFSATTGTESVPHTHGVSITSGTESANHTHTGTTNSGEGAHTHTQRYSQNSVNNGSQINVSDNNGQSSTKQTGNPPGTAEGAHTHTFTTGVQSANHTHLVSGNTGNPSVTHTHTVSGTTGTEGTGTSFDIRPLYLALAYIMKL